MAAWPAINLNTLLPDVLHTHTGFWDILYFPVIFSPLGATIRENGACVVLLMIRQTLRLGRDFERVEGIGACARFPHFPLVQ